MMSCNEAARHVKPNGLSYAFLGHIGPDSCELYRCYYSETSSVLLTVCRDKTVKTTTTWTVREGKTDVNYDNTNVPVAQDK